MGANAQTTVPTFVASQVLTADQMNQSARTGIPVFASTVTRDAGFGGTGEKTLAEGQLCYVEGTGLQSYNGTSWVTWGVAPGAITLVKAQTVGSGVSSVSITDAFNSSYEQYLITITNVVGTGGGNLSFQFEDSGGNAVTTNYYWSGFYNSANNGAVNGNNVNNGSSWSVGSIESTGRHNQFWVAAPFLAARSSYWANIPRGDTNFSYGGSHDSATSYTRFRLVPTGGTLTGGTIRVYGYQNS
jgi:hypothetical protein